MIGQTISHYRIVRELGAGGMGVVYEAVDVRHGGTVAIKLLPPELSRDAQAKQRFVAEARSTFALDHPNLCRVHELDETADGQLFLAMARYEGRTLRERLAQGPLTISEVENLTRQIMRGLAAAHRRGIVHRDIKPANIFLTDDGELKILDFGLARVLDRTRLTQAGASMGTPGYMSPEQCLGQDAGARSDLWSYGVVLYEMLGGRLPFAGDYAQAVIYGILNTDPEPVKTLRPDTPQHLSALVSACLQKDPARRPGSGAEILEMLGESIGEDIPSAALRGPPTAGKRRFFLVGGTALAAVLAALAFWLPRDQAAIASLAVLPLLDHSPELGQEFLANGLTDQLIVNLGAVGVLDRVISYGSVRGYRDNPRPVSEVARVLDVDGIVEGAITRIADRVQITARLIDARSGKQLWGRTFNHDYANLLDLQNEIVAAIVAQISDTLTPEQVARLDRHGDVDPQAYLVYLEGRDKFNQGYHTHEGILEAIATFERAIALDNDFAAAHAGLAECYNSMSCHGFAKPSAGYPKAREAVTMALALDDECADAHAALAHLLFENAWDYTAALREIDRAIGLNPSFGWAYHLKGAGILRCLGRHDEAIAVMRRAYEVDPLSANLSADLAMVLYTAGRFEEAAAQIRKTSAVFPDWDPTYDLVALNFYKGAYADALALLEQADNDPDQQQPDFRAFLAYAKAKAGKLQEARALLLTIEAAYEQGSESAYRLAYVHMGLGESDEALRYLDLAVQERFPRVTRLGIDPTWDPLRGDPRFQEILRAVGLAAS